MIPIDFSKQQALDADPRAIHQKIHKNILGSGTTILMI